MPVPKPEILLVDDDLDTYRAMADLLGKLDVDVLRSQTDADVRRTVTTHDVCLVLIDMQTLGLNSYALVKALRQTADAANLPVIFLSATPPSERQQRQAYRAGVVDVLTKPILPEMLVSKVRVFIELYRQHKALEDEVDQRRQAEAALREANAVLSKRAVQLETGSQVGNQVISILELDELLTAVVGLIQTMFGYYYAGIWLLDEEHEHIVLKASAGRGSARGFKPGYVLDIDTDPSIIARVCRTRRHYLSNDVTHDPHYLYDAGLPDARSELAMPLLFGTERRPTKGIAGALDIQSDRPMAFNAEDLTVLHMLTNQVAVALRNARLYAEVTRLNEALEDQVQVRTSELRKAYEHLEILDRNKSDFIQIVSHELRTPLTLVKGYSQMLNRDPEICKDDTRNLQVSGIITGAQRMQEMIDTMLDVVRIDSDTLSLSLEQVDMKDLFTALSRRFATAIRERHLELTLEDNLLALPKIEGDPEALDKLFEHLLVNAIKYTPDGGAISISGRPLEMRINRQNLRFVEVVVSDTGIGIAPEVQELIFAKFYQGGTVSHHSSGKTKFKGGGPGLGLTIARGIAKAHGGQVWAASPGYDEEACPGSKLHVVLPVAQEQRPQETPISAMPSKPVLSMASVNSG
jgi:signal transduction histidine kinase/DNA-binding response OmpR family regulator